MRIVMQLQCTLAFCFLGFGGLLLSQVESEIEYRNTFGGNGVFVLVGSDDQNESIRIASKVIETSFSQGFKEISLSRTNKLDHSVVFFTLVDDWNRIRKIECDQRIAAL